MKARPGAPAIGDLAKFFQPAKRLAARKALAVESAVAGHFHFEVVRQSVDYRDADAMKAT